MKRLFPLFVVLLVIPFATGCPQQREEAAMSMAKEIAFKIVDKSKLDQTQLSASGQVVNPEYEFLGWGGTGVIVGGKVRAVGVDMKGSASGAGLGESAAVDQDLREKLYQISERKDISREERKKLIAEAVAGFIDRVDIGQPSPNASTSQQATKSEAVLKIPQNQPAGATTIPPS